MRVQVTLLLSLSLLVLTGKAQAQDSSSGTATAPQASPLQGLWTPPAKYQSGVTITPQPLTGNGDNPLRGLWTPQPQYMSGATPTQNQAPPTNTGNQFKGYFTPPQQYQSGVTVESKPVNQSPEFIKNQFEKNGYQPSDNEKDLVKSTYGKDYFEKVGAAAGAKPADGKATSSEFNGFPGFDGDKEKDKEKAATTEKKKSAKDKKKGGKSTVQKKPAEKKPAEKPLVYNPLQDAILMMNSGQYKEALAELTQLLKQEPLNAKAHYLKAVANVSIRDYQHAGDEYRQVIQLAPATPLAQMAVVGLEKIGGSLPGIPKLPPLKLKE